MKNPIATLHPLIKIALPAAAATVGLAMYGGDAEPHVQPWFAQPSCIDRVGCGSTVA